MDFVPEFPVLATFSVACIVLAITPGPDMSLFLSRAISQGRGAGLACMAGALTGIVVHTAMVALGLSALIVAAPVAFNALKLVGAGYLAWLAFDAIRNGSSLNLKAGPTRVRSVKANFLTGLGVNLLNPKIILFFMTFLPQFVSASDPHAIGKFFFLGLMFNVISLPIIVPMILAAHSMADFLKRKPLVTRVIDWIFAGVFSAFAFRILMTPGR
ncbi:MAG: threonine transporter RhtB [Phyllobacteriaceae bacterium]|nr:threonine transporter RhtB [Phyllobacteriaceae bacterium]MBA90804.1 threonine transporter RhtB [Phyllobacteriaceae bacterium]